MEEEKSVIFLGTPLQFLAVVSRLVFHDGMGDSVNLPPFLSDIRAAPVYLSNVFTWQAGPLGKVAIDPTKPADLDPNRQQITLITNYFDERALAYDSLASAVTATGFGAEKSIVSIGCAIPHIWAKIEDGWNWLVSELAARGRIEATPVVAGDGKRTPKKGRPRLTDVDQDSLSVEYRQKALRKWTRLQLEEGMTKSDAARKMWPESNAASSVKKLDRWAKTWPHILDEEREKRDKKGH